MYLLSSSKDCSVYLCYGIQVYHLQGKYEQAIAHCRSKLALSTTMGDRVGICYTLGNLGNALDELGRIDEALACFRQYYDLALSLGDKLNLSRAFSNLGKIFEKKGQPAQALDQYDKAITLAREQGLGQELCEFLHLKAGFLHRTGKTASADEFNRQAWDLAQHLNSPGLMLMVRIQKSELLAETDPGAALALLGKLDPLDESDRAEIAYLTYRADGKEARRQKALELYRELCRLAPCVKNKERLAELEQGPVSLPDNCGA
ncbi:tetratricopeptide repeat protein [candidate division TA06 bacterium]|uniref:Tetratricopeptide repeat protein n=1 Tax=candidate division TA06 bacterium TaxID=2250710 RepID=A0A933ID72_UNCT6|nr:tetratricopeptide repeat protein [candidate division TA06 bacterium]